MAFDPEVPTANQNGQLLRRSPRISSKTGLTGQLRFRVSEQNLYAYLFGVKRPIAHVMGVFRLSCASGSRTSPRREGWRPPRGRPERREGRRDFDQRSAQEPPRAQRPHGARVWCVRRPVRHLPRRLAHHQHRPPPRRGGRARRHQHGAQPRLVGDQPGAGVGDQRIVQTRRAVEIATLNAQAEVEPLTQLTNQLRELRKHGPGALDAYVRNIRLALYAEDQARDRAGGAMILLRRNRHVLLSCSSRFRSSACSLGSSAFTSSSRSGPRAVYVLFGKVLGVIEEPGLHSPLARFGPWASS